MWTNTATMHLMRRVVQQHNALWRDRVADLTPVQYGVLLALEHLPGQDQKTIAKAAAVDETAMAELVRRMTHEGMLTRSPDSMDGRRYRLSLSETGSTALAAAKDAAAAVADTVQSTLTPEGRSELQRLLEALLDHTPERNAS